MTRIFNKLLRSRLLLVMTVLLVAYGLFFMPGTEQGPRYLSALSNLGHIGAFFLIWSFLFFQSGRLQNLSAVRLIVLVLAFSFLIAGLIELLQGLVGRDSEWQDVWDSMVGAMLATAFCASQLRGWSMTLRRFWQVLALVLLVVVPWSIWRDLSDETIIWRQFPVLSDFRTPFELSRWQTSRASLQMQTSAESGRRFLDVTFRPARYSTLTLKYFYPDWRNYRVLVLDVTNPERRAYRVILRIHDRLHRLHDFALNDRFNRELELRPGRQQIKIHLDDVKSAPHSRSMDMQHLQELSLFTMQSSVYHHLYINSLYLE